MELTDFSLKNEDGEYYHIESKAGRKISVKKAELHEKAHALIKKLPKFSDGGEVIPDYLKINDPIQPVETGRDAAAKYFMNDQSDQLPTPANSEEIIANAPKVGMAPAAASLDQTQSVGGTQQAPPFEIPKDISNAMPSDNRPMDISQAPQQQTGTNPADMLGQKQQSVLGALEAQKGFQQQLGQAESEQAKQEAQAIDQTQKKINLMQTQQDLVNQYKTKDDAFAKVLESQKIDPNRYYNNLSTGQKVAQGIALVLGGIGAGLTGGPNQALNIVKDFIDKDIDAQKNDQSKTMNLWKMNREQLGNDMAANLATQNQLYTGLKYNLMKAAAQSNSQQAIARAGMAASTIDQQIAQNRMTQSMIQIGLGNAGGQAQGADPAALVPHLVPPDKQKEVFEEIQNAQNINRERKVILETFDKAAKDVRPVSGGQLKNVIPGVESEYNQALEQLLGPTLGKLEGTVRQAAMDNLKHNALPQLGDNDNKIRVKKEALTHYLESAASAPTAKGFGIDLSKFKSTSIDPKVNFTPQEREYYNWAIQNRNNPKAEIVLKKLGVE